MRVKDVDLFSIGRKGGLWECFLCYRKGVLRYYCSTIYLPSMGITFIALSLQDNYNVIRGSHACPGNRGKWGDEQAIPGLNRRYNILVYGLGTLQVYV